MSGNPVVATPAPRSLALPPMHVRQAGNIAALTQKRKEMVQTASLRALVAPIPRPADVPTPAQYKAKGWPNDDSDAVQAWADAGGQLHLDTKYRCTKPITYSSDTEFIGHGVGEVENPDPAQVTWYNKEATGIRNVTWNGVVFDHDPKMPVTGVENCVAMNVTTIKWIDCVFQNVYYGVTLSNCNDWHFERCKFLSWGDTRKFSNPDTGTWWGGVAVMCVQPCGEGWITDSLWRGGHGICGWFDPGGTGGVTITGAVLDGCVEAGFYGFPVGSYVQISSGKNAARVDVSGHMVEAVGSGWTLNMGRIRKCDGAILYLSGVQDARIVISDADDANRSWGGWSGGGAVMIRNYDPGAGMGCKRISLSASLAATTGFGMHPVSLVNWSGNAASTMEDLDINCSFGDPKQWKSGGGLFLVDPPGSKLLVRSKGILV